MSRASHTHAPAPRMPHTISTLYVCYFGLREPLVQTQVLPYLRQLAAGGVRVRLLTFEPQTGAGPSTAERAARAAELTADGIEWFSLTYHKSPSAPATAYDILAGAREIVRLARGRGVGVLHARAHVPMAMTLLAARRLPGVRLVFDIRGLMAEEYADAGVWREGSALFRAVKKLERAGIRRADGIVVLTRAARDWLVKEHPAAAGKIEVIPCCVDFSRYESGGGAAAAADAGVGTADALVNGTAGAPDAGVIGTAGASDAAEAAGATGGRADAGRFEVVYAGSVTGLYMLEEMAGFFAEVRRRRPGAFFRVLTTSPTESAAEVLRRAGLADEDFHVGGVSAAEVPALLRRARLGLSFRKATFSQIAASPTKIPEYLAAGLPVVGSAGVGDTDELLAGERVGVVVEDFGREALARAAEAALSLAGEAGVAARCEAAARAHFDLAGVGGERYLRLYRRLAGQAAAGVPPARRA